MENFTKDLYERDPDPKQIDASKPMTKQEFMRVYDQLKALQWQERKLLEEFSKNLEARHPAPGTAKDWTYAIKSILSSYSEESGIYTKESRLDLYTGDLPDEKNLTENLDEMELD